MSKVSLFVAVHELDILKGRYLNVFQIHIKSKNLILDSFFFTKSSGKSFDKASLNHFMF